MTRYARGSPNGLARAALLRGVADCRRSCAGYRRAADTLWSGDDVGTDSVVLREEGRDRANIGTSIAIGYLCMHSCESSMLASPRRRVVFTVGVLDP
jgi:hypothetical protein